MLVDDAKIIAVLDAAAASGEAASRLPAVPSPSSHEQRSAKRCGAAMRDRVLLVGVGKKAGFDALGAENGAASAYAAVKASGAEALRG